MNIGVVGSRTFHNYSFMQLVLNRVTLNVMEQPLTIISGGAKGADSLAKQYCEAVGIQIIEILPDWNKYGKSAGPIRNKEIVERSDYIIAFWDGKSRGTKYTIDMAERVGKKVFIYWKD